MLSAVREGWDLNELLAERRAAEARLARWEAERAARDRDTSRWRSRRSLMGEWRGAMSAALDDRQLATAVEWATTPVAGLGRRSVPIVRAQLVAWAVTAHCEALIRPLDEVLADDLVGTDLAVLVPSFEGPLPLLLESGPRRMTSPPGSPTCSRVERNWRCQDRHIPNAHTPDSAGRSMTGSVVIADELSQPACEPIVSLQVSRGRSAHGPGSA